MIVGYIAIALGCIAIAGAVAIAIGRTKARMRATSLAQLDDGTANRED